MRGKGWTRDELNIVTRLYQAHGADGVRQSLRHRTRASIRKKAAELGITVKRKPRAECTAPWTLPAQDLVQQLECVRLRNWRGPVMAGPLVATLGRAA